MTQLRTALIAAVCFAISLIPLGGWVAAFICGASALWIDVPKGAWRFAVFALSAAAGVVAGHARWALAYREYGASFWRPDGMTQWMTLSSLQAVAVAFTLGGVVLGIRYLLGQRASAA